MNDRMGDLLPESSGRSRWCVCSAGVCFARLVRAKHCAVLQSGQPLLCGPESFSMRSERNANRATPCQAFPGTRFGSETTPATDGTSLKGTTVRRMGYNPATQGLRRVIARAGIRETSGIGLSKKSQKPAKTGCPASATTELCTWQKQNVRFPPLPN